MVDHGFFTIHVLAGFQGILGNVVVPMVGGDDQNGVDILSGQNFAVVAGGKNVFSTRFLDPLETSIVKVSHGDKFRIS